MNAVRSFVVFVVVAVAAFGTGWVLSALLDRFAS